MKQLIVVFCLLAVALPVSADTQGETGKLVGLREQGTASDNLSFFQGSLWVAEADLSVREYFWGGSLCPGRDLSEDSVAQLGRNVMPSALLIIPIYEPGQIPDSRCLVEFILVNRNFAGDVNPFPF